MEYLVQKELTKIKTRYESSNIFIFTCNRCDTNIMLHWNTCPHCKAKNYYYDPNIHVDAIIEGEAQNALIEFEKLK